MASGGGSSNRGSLSEHRKRTKAYRVDNEDVSSLGSNRQEDRPNNWDFSDWKPSSAYDAGKRIKKGNNNPDRERENKKEREREQESQSESGARVRQHTPSTFPRTKISSKAPMSQRLAMENLRQHLSFSDVDEISVDGERNNERPIVHRERLTNYTSQTAANMRNETASLASDRDRNSNISKSEGPDSNEIVGRLMQIRDYIKQASSMMNNLKKSSDPGDQGRAKQLNQVIQRLKEQEQKYLDLLLKISNSNVHCDKLEIYMKQLELQERDFLMLLERQLAAREEDMHFSQNLTESANSRQESDTEAESVDLDVRSDNSGNTTDANEDQTRGICRPNIEDRLGRHSDTELEDLPSARSSRSKESELDNTLVAEPNTSEMEQEQELLALTSRRQTLENDVDQKNEELNALRQQHEMLKQMLHQQEQLRALQGRQAALQALQRDAEEKLEEQRVLENEDASNLGAAAAASSVMTNGLDSGAEGGQNDMDALPQELKDLRRRLDYLKNIYDIQDPESMASEARSINTEQSELSMTSIERRHLSDKLEDLQEKKVYMDQLLHDLHSLRRQQRPQLNNGMDGMSVTSSQGHIMESVAASASAGHTAAEAQEVLELLEARKKQKKLHDVRGRLNQLRDLVQYYQTGTEFIHGETDDMGASSAAPSDAAVDLQNHNIRQPSKKSQVTQKLRHYANSGRGDSFDQQSDVSSMQSDTSDTESHVSSSAAWGEDPEIQDKVKKLKAAKDKLRQLQELVSMVQQSPDIAHALPDDLAELAYSIGGEATSQISQASTQPVRASDTQSLQSEGEIQQDESELNYEVQMQEQRQELEQLMDERSKLLSIQEQLQKLHDQMGQTEERTLAEVDRRSGQVESRQRPDTTRSAPSEDDDRGEESDTNNTRVKTVQETSQVTFQEPPEVVQSYDELYGRMRQQRMLREELREKKKELEIMMSKDRPKKQYSRNQDNQSDNISFSNKSDPFGSKSEDYTMATWGGSTVDNLESIEEDEDGSGAGQEPDDGEADDGYPSDGIVQVEEEEEAQESDDHDTYTIEDEYNSRHARQAAIPKRPTVDGRSTRGGRRRRRGAPLMEQREEESRHYEYNYWAPDKNKVLNNVRSRRRASRKREKAERDSALEQEVRSLRQQLEDVRTQMISSTVSSPAQLASSAYQFGPNPLMMAQMQQQLVMNLSQSYQQLCLNQHDSSDRLRRLENHLLRAESADDIVSAARREHLGVSSIPTSASFTHSPVMANPYRIPSSAESPGQFAQRLASGSVPESDSYLQQFRAARARAAAGQSAPDSQFKLDPRPFNFEADSTAFLNNPNAYAMAQGYGETELEANFAAQNMQHQVVQTEDIMSEASAVPSELMSAQNGACPKQKTSSNGYQPQELPSSSRRSPRTQTALANHGDMLSGIDYSPMTTARTNHSDIQIDTILAKDRGKIPPLDLDTILKNRSKLAKHMSKEIASEVSTVASSRSDAVVGRKFPTPSRANAASRLASRQVGPNRPGLSAGISGTTFMDASSMASLSSAVSSVPGGGSVDAVARAQLHATSMAGSQNVEQESDATISDFTVFETLRETIYAEVATLISQNEMRPHFLIELFRELQMLSTDYLRQRALYIIQDLVTRHLTEEESQKGEPNKQSSAQAVPYWPSAAGRVMSEHTPSESLITSDDEEIKAQLYARSPHGRPRPQQQQGLPQDDCGSVSGSVKSDRFDYAEIVDTTSSMSTPTSSNYWDNDHFAKDSLGDTVIHFDKAFQRMREYERRVAAGEDADAAEGAVGGKCADTSKTKDKHAEVVSSSAQGSDTSNSDVPDDSVSSMSELSYPRIDTQQLDKQIKAIMTEVIPVLKEHMDEVCSQHLLTYVRRLVLSLTKNRDDQHEFARFFHKQLGSIVQDSLAKFEGRKMRECGEDMLVELSEILFNELAFFRLMQDLDDPKAKVKANVKARVKHWQHAGRDSQTSTETGERRDDDDQLGDETTSAGESTDSEAESGVDQESREVTDQQEEGDDEDDDNDEDESESNYSNETDDLGKQARDDELAAQIEITEKDEDSESPHKSPVKIELAVSEIKSFTRIGSDEDDEGEDDVQSVDDVSETAVSRDIHNEVTAINNGSAALPYPMAAHSNLGNDIETDEDSKDQQEKSASEVDTSSACVTAEASDSTADSASGLVLDAEPTEAAPGGGGGAVMNGEVHEDEDIITVDDLPAKFAGLSKDNPALEEKRAAEDEQNSGVAAVMEVLDGAAAGGDAELAGDPNALKEPEYLSQSMEFNNDNVLYLTAPDGSTIMTPGLKMNESLA